MLPHPLTHFVIQKYYENELRFNGVYSRDNLPYKIKDKAYIVNLDEYSDIRTHWVALFVNHNDVTYFDNYGAEYIPKETKKIIHRLTSFALRPQNKNIKRIIFRIQAYNSIMCRYFCIEFINFMLAGKTLTDFTNLLLPNYFKKTII